jgi:hypothetical protein
MKKKKVFSPILVNATEMARQYPDSFEQPSKSERDKLQIGDLAKVCDMLSVPKRGRSPRRYGWPSDPNPTWLSISPVNISPSRCVMITQKRS